MKKLILVGLFLIQRLLLFAQTDSAQTIILSKQEIAELFSDTSNKHFNFIYHIRRVYKCNSKSQNQYIVLTESKDSISSKDKAINRHIKAYIFEERKRKLTFVLSLNDSTVKREYGVLENSIWFWTNYCEFNDIDGDGLIDPLFIYGASGTYEIEDARIIFIIYYKKQKVVIRHQNSPVDYGRNIKITAAYYSLPIAVQNHVKLIMERMAQDNNAIFPHGWREGMKKKKLYVDDN